MTNLEGPFDAVGIFHADLGVRSLLLSAESWIASRRGRDHGLSGR
jgi:hypothetical protein